MPRASSRIRAGEAALRPGRPFLPGAGWRSPRIELVGLLRRTFFSLMRPQHRAWLSSGSLRAGKSPGLTPSLPGCSCRLRQGSGASDEGAGRSRRERGGAVAQRVDKARRGVRRDGVRPAGRGVRREAGPGRLRRTPPSGPRGPGGRAPWRLLQLVQLLPRAPKWSSGDASAAHLDPLPRPPNLRPQSPEGCLFGVSHAGRWTPLPAGPGGYSPRRLRGAGRRRCVRGAGTPGHLGPLWE